MSDFTNAKIYKLCSKDENIKDIYIGSTINYMNRLISHRCNCNNENQSKYKYKVYDFIRNNGGFNNWTMKIISHVKVKNKSQLKKLERSAIDLFQPTLNSSIPGRTNKEYYIDNCEKIKEAMRVYRINNKEKLYKKNICECGGRYMHDNKSSHFKTKKHINYINSQPPNILDLI